MEADDGKDDVSVTDVLIVIASPQGCNERLNPDKTTWHSHHHEFDLNRWWSRLEKTSQKSIKKLPATGNKRNINKSSNTYQLAWFKLWWKGMHRR